MPPYRGATVLDTLEQVRNQEPVPPRRLIPQIPRDLETIALKCLEKNPAGRYATAEAMAGDLRCWLDGRPISARPVSPLDKIWRRCRRRPVVAALAAALTLVLSIGFLIVILLWRYAEAERRRAEDELDFAGLMLSEMSSGAGLTGLLHHQRKSMNIKELRIRTWVNASDCPARSYAQSVAPGAVSSLLQATYVDQEKQRKSCPYKDLCLYC